MEKIDYATEMIDAVKEFEEEQQAEEDAEARKQREIEERRRRHEEAAAGEDEDSQISYRLKEYGEQVQKKCESQEVYFIREGLLKDFSY